MACIGIILVSPKHHANVGGIARSMTAFGFEHLIIVAPNPACHMKKAAHISEQGKTVIERCQFVPCLSALTGSKVATISAFDNRNYAKKLTKIHDFKEDMPFYLVMGREGSGLTDDELSACDECITIPTNGKYGVLNLCSATTICLYEFTRRRV